MKLTLFQKGWLAAAIDGEGCIINNPKTTVGAIEVCGTNENFIRFAHMLLGSKSKVHTSQRSGNRKLIYITRVSDKKSLLNILPQIIPYLIIKKEKCENLLERVKKRRDYKKPKCFCGEKHYCKDLCKKHWYKKYGQKYYRQYYERTKIKHNN